MGSTRDFITATLADAIAPSFRRPVEDIIYETLDRRQIPTRTDFKELRDIINTLRSQGSGATNGIKKLKDGLDEIEENFCEMETKIVDLTDAVSQLSVGLQEALSKINAIDNNSKGTKSRKSAAPKSKEVHEECKVSDCNSPQRAWDFCAPHYAKWRRGTLDGFVNYNGNVIVGENMIPLIEHKGKAFTIKDNSILIEGEVIATL
jgi:hypothetical protein